MSTSAPDAIVAQAVSVAIEGEALVVALSDGRRVSVPLDWYPRLAYASGKERRNARLIGQGRGIQWPDIEEDISVESILLGRRSMESDASLKRWIARRRGRTQP